VKTPKTAPAKPVAPTPAPEPKKRGPTKENPIVLRYASPSPLTSKYVIGDNKWMDAVHEATGGRVKIEFYPAGTLSKHGAMYYDCLDGVVDMIWEQTQWYPGTFSLYSVLNLPFLGVEGIWDIAGISWELYQKFPAIQDEFEGVKLLATTGWMAHKIGTAKKKITKLEDMEGLKMRVGGAQASKAMELLGAIPMQPPWMEMVPMLQKGVVDGEQFNLGLIATFGHGEAINYMYWMPLWNTEGTMNPAINRLRWDSFPKDIQDAIMSVSGLEHSMDHARISNEKHVIDAVKWMKDNNKTLEFTYPTPEEKAEWVKIAGQPIWDEWLAEMEKQGKPGQAVLDYTLELVEKYNRNPTRYLPADDLSPFIGYKP